MEYAEGSIGRVFAARLTDGGTRAEGMVVDREERVRYDSM